MLNFILKNMSFYDAGICFSLDSSVCLVNSSSLSSAIFCHLILEAPVPAGIRRPTKTFSFSPLRWSTLPLIAASVSTLVVSWKEAADINELVWREALVIPNNILSPTAGFLFSFFKISFWPSYSILSIISPVK